MRDTGFPPNSEVEIKLGGLNTSATDRSYTTLQADPHGEVIGAFTMPDRWPNGHKIMSPHLMVVATTRDFMDKASAVFNYYTDTATP